MRKKERLFFESAFKLATGIPIKIVKPEIVPRSNVCENDIDKEINVKAGYRTF